MENIFGYFYWKKAIVVTATERLEIVGDVIMSVLKGVSEYLSKTFTCL